MLLQLHKERQDIALHGALAVLDIVAALLDMFDGQARLTLPLHGGGAGFCVELVREFPAVSPCRCAW
jgi:hypothetical protein